MTSDQTNKPLRISFLIFRPSMSGGARVIAKYARMLKEREHEVFLTGLGAPQLTMKQTLKQWLGLRPRWTDPPSHYALEGLDMQLIDGREQLVASDLPDADVVVATFWRTAEWLADLPPEKGARVYFVQGHEAAMPHTDKPRAAKTYAVDAKLITVSTWLSGILRDDYGRKDVALAPNAVDAAAFQPQTPRVKNASPVVGFVGSKNSVKRSDLAIDTCIILRERFADLRVLVFAAHDIGARQPLPEWFDVSVNPPQQKIAEIYGACDLWLFTSDEEGFGLPMLEAFAAGTPVAARPAGAATDLVTPDNGVLIDSDDPKRIAEAAAGILSLAPSEWKRLSDNALTTARAHDWDASFKKFETALYAAVKR